MALRAPTAGIYRLQRYIWLPLQQQAVITGGCIVAILVLGALGFAGFPAFKSYADIAATSPHRLATFLAVLFVCNYVFLLRQSRPSYLSLRRAALPTLSCELALLLLACAATLLLTPTASQPQTAGDALRTVFVAEGGLSAVLLLSGFFKNDNELILGFAGPVGEISRSLAAAERGMLANDREEGRQARTMLLFHLNQLADWLDKNGPLVPVLPPETMAGISAACQDLQRILPGLQPDAFVGGRLNAETDVILRLKLIAEHAS